MKYIIANWKMRLGVKEAAVLAKKMVKVLRPPKNVTAILCPSFPALASVAASLRGSKIKLGGQDMFWEERGQYTGEVSPLELRELGCDYVIIGHSERRQNLGETDEMVKKKVAAALSAKLTPIVCVGETLAEREAGRRDEVVTRQTFAALESAELKGKARLVVAYEPVWAIGGGRAVAPSDAAASHRLIRKILKEKFGENDAKNIFVIYGGSVDETNIAGFFSEPEIEGALVGGASLQTKSFSAIAKAAT